jgi:hypothetical protein
VDGGAHHVETCEHLVRDVEGAVLADVHLGAREHPEAPELPVQLADGAHLLEQLRLVVSVGDAEIAGVVGDGDVVEAERAGRPGHLLEGGVAVAPVAVDLEIAAQVARRDQPGQSAGLCGLDLTAVLAQLGRNPGQVEGAVELLFGAAGDPLRAAEEPVLVELELALPRDAPQRDVVALAAREVGQGRAEALERDCAQVGVDTVLESHEGLRLASGVDVNHLGHLGEELRDGCGLLGGDQEVEIADRLLAATDRSRHGDLDDARHLAQPRRDLAGERKHGADGGAPDELLLELDGA